jgi:hypothetical protein
VFVTACIIAFLASIFHYSIYSVAYQDRLDYYNLLDEIEEEESLLIDSCRTYVSEWVDRNENIKNKQEVKNRLEDCKFILSEELAKERDAIGYYDYTIEKDYIIIADKFEAERYTITHELLHLADIRSNKKYEICFDSLFNRDINYFEYKKNVLNILVGQNDTLYRNCMVDSTVEAYIIKDYKTLSSKRSYYLGDLELFVRLNLFVLFVNEYMNDTLYWEVDKPYIFGQATDSLIECLMNGTFYQSLPDEYQDKFYESDFLLILPALKHNKRQFNLVI